LLFNSLDIIFFCLATHLDNFFWFSRWWKQWLASGEDGLIYHFSGPGPVYCSHDSHLKSPHFFKQSSIDSTDLFIQLKQEEEIEQQAEPLLKNNDYVILPEQVWTAFQKW
jgi:hypothetical protein